MEHIEIRRRKPYKKSKVLSLIFIEVLVELAYALIWFNSFKNCILCDYFRYVFRNSPNENSHNQLFFYKLSKQSDKLDYIDNIEIIFSLILDVKTILFAAILVRWYIIVLSVKRLLNEKEVFYLDKCDQ